jgi:hypothetical protein
MPDIKHSIQIDAAREVVHPLVAAAPGFTEWWAADVTETKSSGAVDLGFFNRATSYGLRTSLHRSRRSGSAKLEKSGAALGCSSISPNRTAKLRCALRTPAGRRRRIILSPATRPGAN